MAWLLVALGFLLTVASQQARAQIDPRLEEVESRRIAIIEKLKPSVVAVFAPGGQGGGSGVLISADGYTLTNFHVVQGLGPVMQCGLADGVLYDAVLVGVDKVGDVALIKLLPAKEGQLFPFAKMGNSDAVQVGDWSLAMGNPLLATDFTPTVTFGLVSGVHRYQYPESSRGLLEYTDCIQVDTSINPGNSGGPLFNLDGELIGINGRISLEKRQRLNSGVGYAISINQIKNFMGHLRAGLEADHATLGAFIANRADESNDNAMVVASIIENCNAHRRGLDVGDELVAFAGRPISNRNHYQNVLGLYPKGWRVPLTFRRDNNKKEILVRLMGAQRQEVEDGRPKPPETPPPAPRKPKPAGKESPALKFFEAKPGFANFYFDRLERDRLLEAFHKHGEFGGLKGAWTLDADFEINQKSVPATLVIGEEKDSAGKIVRTLVKLTLGGVVFNLDPLATSQDPDQLMVPKDSGGLLMALYQLRRLLVVGPKGFEGQMSHGGFEPFYPRPLNGPAPQSLAELRVDTEVLTTEHAATVAKWYFDKKDHRLLGAEVHPVRDEDPCELYFHDQKPVEGRLLPHRIEIRYGNGRFGILSIRKYHFAGA